MSVPSSRYRVILALLAALVYDPLASSADPLVPNNPGGQASGGTYTAAANGGLSLSGGNAFSLGDGVGISYTSPGQLALAVGTVTVSTPAINVTETWNAAGTVFGAPIFENVTNTASATGSLLLDLQVSSVRQFSVDKSGNATMLSGSVIGFNPSSIRNGNLEFSSSNIVGTNNFQTITSAGFGGAFSTPNAFLSSPAVATLHHGVADAAAPVPQFVGVQGVVAGTTNTAGVLWTETDSTGTGSAASGGYAWQTHPAGTTGTAQNTAVTKMALSTTGDFTLAQYVSCTTLVTNASGQLLCNGVVP